MGAADRGQTNPRGQTAFAPSQFAHLAVVLLGLGAVLLPFPRLGPKGPFGPSLGHSLPRDANGPL